MKFSVFQVSRKGGRERNEDRMGYAYTRQSGLFLLADGMGGHPEGDVAAQLALQTVSALYQREAQPRIANVTEFLATALLSAHHSILRYALEKKMSDAPRTTLIAAVVQDQTAWWVHCGDSRLYLVRNGRLLLRTRDHSYLDQRERDPLIAASAGAHNRHVLFTCLGSNTRPVFDISEAHRLQRGDKILLCSDGLWSNIYESDLAALLSAEPVAQAVPELVERALRKGGEHCDNVTALALEWESSDSLSDSSDVSTDSISDGVFASTIQAGLIDPGLEELDEASIERAIAEINQAIKRSSDKKT